MITLTKDYAKIIKKNKSIPQVAGDELDVLVQKYSKQLDDKYTALNEARTKHIQDSIAKAKADSIEIEKLKAENELIKAKAELAKSQKNNEELFKKAIEAMKNYSGNGDAEDYDY